MYAAHLIMQSVEGGTDGLVVHENFPKVPQRWIAACDGMEKIL